MAPIFLTSALVGGEWSATRPCRFTSRAKEPRSMVDPRAGVDVVEERNILHFRESNPDRPILLGV
jgi:hypothetical protein